MTGVGTGSDGTFDKENATGNTRADVSLTS